LIRPLGVASFGVEQADDGQPLSTIASYLGHVVNTFEDLTNRTAPLPVIWDLKLHGPAERFNVPQANLADVPLCAAFGWAYYHFILEDGARLPQPFTSVEIDPTDYTQLALGHALATASG